MADLTFGEPLGMLESSEYTPWVKAVFEGFKFGVIWNLRLEYPILAPIAEWLVPKSIRKMEKAHLDYSAERVDQRLAEETKKDRADI